MLLGVYVLYIEGMGGTGGGGEYEYEGALADDGSDVLRGWACEEPALELEIELAEGRCP